MKASPLPVLAFAAALAALCGAVDAATPSNVARAAPADPVKGEKVYLYWCAACHARGPEHPGTQSLEIKYGGKQPAALEDRRDLSPEITRYYVRRGIALMPPFRKTEISDADLRDLSAYLARKR